jgi:hypothetical protein
MKRSKWRLSVSFRGAKGKSQSGGGKTGKSLNPSSLGADVLLHEGAAFVVVVCVHPLRHSVFLLPAFEQLDVSKIESLTHVSLGEFPGLANDSEALHEIGVFIP